MTRVGGNGSMINDHCSFHRVSMFAIGPEFANLNATLLKTHSVRSAASIMPESSLVAGRVKAARLSNLPGGNES
jgi:hypothetical protein